MIKKTIIKIENLNKNFFLKKSKLNILKNFNLNIYSHDIISIKGPSGCGKSTFLNIIGMLDSNFEGSYDFMNESVISMTEKNKNIIRNQSIGFVHQFFHLIPELSVWENVALPKMIGTNNSPESLETAKLLIQNFELSDRINFKPINLSGGEQQRVAIARSMINNPKIIIADEMTGNLDESTSDKIFDFFLREVNKNKQSLVFVTHNEKYANKANTRYQILKGNLIRL